MNYFAILFYSLLFMALASCGSPAAEEKSLQQIAAEVNAKCPQMIDSETKFDGIEIKGNNTVVYKYTLVNLLLQNVDTAEFRRALWPGILSIIKVNADMKPLRDRHTYFEYYYQDKQNRFIYSFKISPADYIP